MTFPVDKYFLKYTMTGCYSSWGNMTSSDTLESSQHLCGDVMQEKSSQGTACRFCYGLQHQ